MSRCYIEPLSEEHTELFHDFYVLDSEECDYFKRYLKLNGILDNQQGLAKTYLYIEEGESGKKILGFYALRCSSLIVDDVDEGERHGEPAVEILELAVHREFRKKGIGEQMMKNIIATADELSLHYLGVKYLVVCAKDSAKTYYEKFGFAEIPGTKKIPRNYDNKSCIGMFLRLKFKE